MKSISLRQIILCSLAVLLSSRLLMAGWVHAQGARFTQRERIQRAMDNSPELVIAALESILTSGQIAALESALLPVPTDAQKREALDEVKLKLLHTGFAQDDPLVAAISSRAEEIAVDTAPSEPVATTQE